MRDYRIASVVGARPNFIKLMPIHRVLKNGLHHDIIHTGQHYDFELSEIFFKEFDLPKPHYNLDIRSGSPGYQVGEMITKIEQVLLANKYDLVLVYGDTNSTFAGAFAAVKANVKVAHIEAGLRSFDKRMPEETNRILTDDLSDYLFPSTNTAKFNLQRENSMGKIYETGDLSVEIISEIKKYSSKSRIIKNLDLGSRKYIVFTMHRAENTEFDDTFVSIIKVFESLPETKFVLPIHPRTRKILKSKNLYQKLENCKNLLIINPVGYSDFISLVQNANKIITDSGGLQKEAYLLSVPCITIRRNTEWTETVREGWNILTDTNPDKIVSAVNKWVPENKIQKPIFGDGNTSKTIKKILFDDILR